jgi:hypothetical protein
MKQINYSQIKLKLIDLCLFSSIQGLPRFLRTEKLLIKFIWLISLIISPCFAVYYMNKILVDYSKFDITSQIDVTYENESDFPPLSFCSTSVWNNSKDLNNLRDMILYCRFSGFINCKSNLNFFESFIDPIYNLCYRFNSNSSIKTKTTGCVHLLFYLVF